MALPLIICVGQPSFPWFVHLENGGDDASLPEVPSTVVSAWATQILSSLGHLKVRWGTHVSCPWIFSISPLGPLSILLCPVLCLEGRPLSVDHINWPHWPPIFQSYLVNRKHSRRRKEKSGNLFPQLLPFQAMFRQWQNFSAKDMTPVRKPSSHCYSLSRFSNTTPSPYLFPEEMVSYITSPQML